MTTWKKYVRPTLINRIKIPNHFIEFIHSDDSTLILGKLAYVCAKIINRDSGQETELC